ncbi:hypothetical protein ZTR_04668 [Talaromyces verruculosus]|nr:hypothetical protein ZTR_04668 [Talaromyces verruculosus]
MANIIAATKAELGLGLPSLLVVSYLEQNGTRPSSWVPLNWTHHRAFDLGDGISIQLTSPDGAGRAWSDWKITEPVVISESKVTSHKGFGNAQRLFNQLLRELESHLTLRTYISGRYKTSVDDIALWAAIRDNPITLSPVKKVYCNVSRWYSFIEASNPWITKATKDLTSSNMMGRARERAARSTASSSFDVVGLPQVDGSMVTRFPSEPSGYLHIGHAKAALLND